MAHLKLFKQATPGGANGIEVATSDELLFDALFNTNGSRGAQIRMFCVRCDAGFKVPTLTITASSTSKLYVGSISQNWTALKTVAPFSGFWLGSLWYWQGGSSWGTSTGFGGSVTLTNILQTNVPFYIFTGCVAGEAGDYQDCSINFSFNEEVV